MFEIVFNIINEVHDLNKTTFAKNLQKKCQRFLQKHP